MMRRKIAKKGTIWLLAVVLLMGVMLPVYADTIAAGQERVAVGADLTAAQKEQIYKDFGIKQGKVNEIVVTNQEERKYLQGLVPESVIGTKAYSSIYIETKKSGKGLDISLTNITWVSQDVYRNALATAGITDANVIISAPFGVSGTAALTGIYKAYEDITGQPISETVKEVAAEELVVSSELSEQLGDSEAVAALINELKLKTNDFKSLTDDQVKEEIKKIAVDLNINLNFDQIDKVLQLVRSLEKIDLNSIKGTLESISQKIGSLSESLGEASGWWDSVKAWFGGVWESISGFFSGLFS